MRKNKSVTKLNQNGLAAPLLLVMLTMTITIFIITDFFKLNQSVNEVIRNNQGQGFLQQDLHNILHINAAIRNSVNHPGNKTFKNCLLSGGGSCPKQHEEFYLASPIYGGPYVAGTAANPTLYDTKGVICSGAKVNCNIMASAYFKETAGKLELWVLTGQIKKSKDLKKKLTNAPSVLVDFNAVLKL